MTVYCGIHSLSRDFVDVPEIVKRQEVFAQVFGLHATDRADLKAQLPLAHKFIERALHESEKIRAEAGQPAPSWVSLYTVERSDEAAFYRFVARGKRQDGSRVVSAEGVDGNDEVGGGGSSQG